MGLYEILKTSKLGAGAAPDMYTALLAQKISKGGSGGEAELSGVPPLTFRSNGTPLLDFLISGNTVQSGTPTPDNPIMPQGTGERTENLFDKDAQDTTNGYEAGHYINNNGVTVIDFRWDVTEYIPCIQQTVYCFSNCVGAAASICWYDSNKNFIGGSAVSSLSGFKTMILTSPTNASYVRTCVLLEHSGSGSQQYDRNVEVFMITRGLTAPTSYIPYGYKLPLTSAGQNVDIYLGEVETTRKIKKLVLTGEENWSGSAIFRIGLSGQIGTIAPICTHYRGVTTAAYGDLADGRITVNGGVGLTLAINDSVNQTSLTAWKAYLAQQYAAGTPVTVWYVLAGPETAVVNEPLMKIGDYAGTLSMEQAGVQIPTNKGNTTLDVLTAVKPSNVSIKYRV